MAFIVGKKQDGKTYYYLAESAGVEGKPRIVSQRYLGSAEEIAARLSEAGPGEPDRSRHLAFGDVAAVWELLGRLRVRLPIPQHSMSICRGHFEVFCQIRTCRYRSITRFQEKHRNLSLGREPPRSATAAAAAASINWCAAADTRPEIRWTTNLSFFPPCKES